MASLTRWFLGYKKSLSQSSRASVAGMVTMVPISHPATALLRCVRRFFSGQESGHGFGVAFDIDGVLLRGGKLIKGAPQALRRLYDDPSSPAHPRVPFIFLTNGGGVTESVRAAQLSKLLDIPVSPLQVLLGHTPFQKLVHRFANKSVLAVGKEEPHTVMASYGFRRVVLMDDYVAQFDHIDPLAQHKPWAVGKGPRDASNHAPETIEAVFVVSDPLDWGRDLQVLCDVLRSGGLPGNGRGPQPPLFFAADDLEYQAGFPVARFGMGSFRVALESLYNRISKVPLSFTSYGKPQTSVFTYAAKVLQEVSRTVVSRSQPATAPLHTIYMIGDNPATDIRGANEAGPPWRSILTRTGVYGQSNSGESVPAHQVVEDVAEAIDFIAKEEGLLHI